MGGILWVIVVILVIIWLVSFLAFHVTAGLIHILLIAAVIIVIYNLVTGRKTV
ncbi:MAG: lmo0937 family membrane protein [Candidatus Eremiobacteraeota bacterium]|nr:lmo0937 family membrane protein [Candidatus Eremiobacteraeota bacterium]MBC5827363.1 lmo0937 family membrane protein [Candidatus Eremiobacteraeota bacterium]